MDNPLQPRAALALAVAQGEDFSCALRHVFSPSPFGEGRVTRPAAIKRLAPVNC
jgi:hypothetical protein